MLEIAAQELMHGASFGIYALIVVPILWAVFRVLGVIWKKQHVFLLVGAVAGLLLLLGLSLWRIFIHGSDNILPEEIMIIPGLIFLAFRVYWSGMLVLGIYLFYEGMRSSRRPGMASRIVAAVLGFASIVAFHYSFEMFCESCMMTDNQRILERDVFSNAPAGTHERKVMNMLRRYRWDVLEETRTSGRFFSVGPESRAGWPLSDGVDKKDKESVMYIRAAQITRPIYNLIQNRRIALFYFDLSGMLIDREYFSMMYKGGPI